MPWQTIHSRVAYENPWMRVREDSVLRPDGRSGIYGVVEVRQPAVFVVALDDDDQVLLVTVDRYATGRLSVEIPAGGTDGQDPLVAARRELREETGVIAERWIHVGSMDALNGIADAPEHVFVAQGLSEAVQDATRSQAEEGISDVRRVPFASVLGLVADGTIRDAETIAALMFAGIHLGRFG